MTYTSGVDGLCELDKNLLALLGLFATDEDLNRVLVVLENFKVLGYPTTSVLYDCAKYEQQGCTFLGGCCNDVKGIEGEDHQGGWELIT